MVTLKKFQKLFLTVIFLNCISSLFISCDEDKNPAGPSGSSYNDTLFFEQDTLTTFINDTIIQEVKCNTLENCSKFIYLENSISDTSSSNFFKKSWKTPGQKHISVWAIKKNGMEIKQKTFEVIVYLGKPSLKVDSIKTCYVKDSLLINATSNDSNGTVVKYLWSCENKKDTTAVPYHKYAWPDPENKIVYVCCVDDDGIESDFDSCIVDVNKGNPMVTPLRDTTCFINDTILLYAHATDENGQIKSFLWSSGDNNYTSGDSLFKYSWKSPGQKTIFVKAVDDDSVQSKDDTCIIIVREGKPVVHLAQGQNHKVRDTVIFSATHYDTNGVVEKYVWQYNAGGVNKTDTVSPGQYKIAWPDTGKKRVTLKAIDDDGIVSSPDTCYLSIAFGAVPVVRLMNDTTIYIKDTLVVTATGIDSNGTVSRYNWSVNSTTFGNSTISGFYPLTWSDSGKNVVYVQAKDNDGQLSNIDSCIVNVKAGLPVGTAVNDTTVSGSCNGSISRLLKAHDENLSGSGFTWFLDTGATAGWDYSSKDSVITFTKPGGGVLNVVWAACDDDGNYTKRDTFTITFNRSPACSLLSPRETANWLMVPTSSGKGSVIFEWNGSDPDGLSDIASYNFYLGKTLDNLQLQYSGKLTSDTVSSIDTSTQYFWKVTVKDKFNDSALVNGTFITRYGQPVICSEPHDTTIFKGETASFSINVTGHDLHYKWLKNNTIIDSLHPVLTISAANYSDKDSTYYCIVSNGIGADTSRFAKLTVKPRIPVIGTTAPVDTTVMQRTKVQFRVFAFGDSLKYQWQKNDTNIANGGNDSVYVSDSTKLSDNGKSFRCIVSNSSGADTSRGAILIVNLAPPIIITHPKDTSVTDGSRARMKVVVQGDSLHFQWQKNEIDLMGKNNDSLIIPSALFSDSGDYRCIVSNSAGMDSSETMTLKVNLNTYSISYNGNGNTGGNTPSLQTKTQGISLALFGNTGNLVKSGYSFEGWNTAPDGTGTGYIVGASYTEDANLTLYAKWTILPTYTISYNGNGNTSGSIPSTQIKTQGITLTLSGNTGTLVKSGYVFAGWNTSSDGTGTDYTVGANYTVDANLTLYAKWIPTYTITYDGNGNTGGSAPSTQIKTQGVSITLSGNTGNLVKTGYTFAGWNTASGGTGTGYSVGANYTVDANLTLYAKWIPTYTITYNGNGSTSGSVPSTQTKIQGVSITLSGNTGNLVKTGYTFAGWNTASGGSGTDYAVGANYTVDASVTLYAKWTLPTYTVSYDGNGSTGGTVPTDTNAYLQGATISVKGNTGSMTRTGYVFYAWNTAANGSGTSYPAGTTFTIGTANVVLYAQWVATTVTDADGNVYTTVIIGHQVWTVENLRTSQFNDGAAIQYVADNSEWESISTPGYCFYNNTTSASEREKYGALYNWFAVNTGKLAPAGWQVPSDSDWTILKNYLVAKSVNYDTLITTLSGYRAFSGVFENKDTYSYWWSTTKHEYTSNRAYLRSIDNTYSDLKKDDNYKISGYSVRLVRYLK